MSEYDLHTLSARPPAIDPAPTTRRAPVIHDAEVKLAGWKRDDVFPVLFTGAESDVRMWHREGADVIAMVELSAYDDMRIQRDKARALCVALGDRLAALQPAPDRDPAYADA